MSKYQEIKEKAYKMKQPGVFYAFDDKQFVEGLIREGYIEEGQTYEDFKKKGIKLYADGHGGYGTKEALDNGFKKYLEIDKEISEQCNPDEIFEYEWRNHECGYTGDWSEALNITKAYFPKYTPTRKLLKKLQKEFNKCNR